MIFVFLIFCLILWLGGMWLIHTIQKTKREILQREQEEKEQIKQQRAEARRIAKDKKLHPERYIVQPSPRFPFFDTPGVGIQSHYDPERGGRWFIYPDGRRQFVSDGSMQYMQPSSYLQNLSQMYSTAIAESTFTPTSLASQGIDFTNPPHHTAAEEEMKRQQLLNSIELMKNAMNVNPETFDEFIEGLTNEKKPVEIKEKGGE